MKLAATESEGPSTDRSHRATERTTISTERNAEVTDEISGDGKRGPIDGSKS
ncbi:hypothetical protein [Lysinibacillus sp. JNUCC 51]|uniref:hypothetical protein n=1 Tax=Lysinibacillus sp. JNUCC-51 TaxID=2792479 RepID=UPI0019363F6F|nr:hypothetical protein JNUCC51_02790 [Lysinibacillus sp. JNUCC-51]